MRDTVRGRCGREGKGEMAGRVVVASASRMLARGKTVRDAHNA